MNNCRVMGGEESLCASLKEREEEKKLSRKMFFVNLFLLYFTDVREDEGFVRRLCIKYTSLINRNNGKIFFTLCKLYLIFATKTIKYI